MFSSVLMEIVLQNLQIHEGVYFVPYIIWSIVQSVMFMAAPIKRWIIQKHAIDIRLNGEDIKVIVTTKKNLVSEESCEDQVKCCHGSLLYSQMYNPMMNQCLKFNILIISHHADFIVLKLYVHHVEL